MIQFHPEFKFSLIFSLLLFIVLLVTLTSQVVAQKAAKVGLANLRVEYQVNPIGIDVLIPRLSWEIVSDERNVRQTAFQVRAAAEAAHLTAGKNLLWDSGKIASEQSIQIEYQGPALKSGQRIYWQVRIWDEKDRASNWSKAAFWEMGLLSPNDWKASWIEPNLEEDLTKSQPCPFLRKEFSLSKKIKAARAYVSSLGLYELYLNGQRVGDQVLTPGWTSYYRRVQYQTYDITAMLVQGKNAAGAILGDGWFRGFLSWTPTRNYYGQKLALLAQIQVEYQDGTSEVIGTDESWRASTGPILESDIYNGEIYDARRELTGWNQVGFDDQNWQAVKITSPGKRRLVAAYGPPVRRIQEIKPIAILKTPAGETVFDMGQNMVGWTRLRVQGPAGTTVTLKHAEVLDKNGNLYTENLRSAKQRDQYILKGGGEEIFEPHFTFHGFRYVAVTGFPGQPTLNHLTGIVIHSDMTPTGSFVCSNPLINQLQHNIQWGQKGNFVDVPTDCPQRDERMGWTGDAQVFSPTACFNMDVAGFYTKWLKDLAADQFQDGVVPHVIPDVLRQGGAAAWDEVLETQSNSPALPESKAGGSSAWADAAVVVPWTVYLYFGDRRILEEQYSSMKAWVDYMKLQAGDTYLWQTGGHFGDWLAFATNRSDYPGATTDKDLIATAYFAHSTDILQRVAAILGKENDARSYAELFSKIKRAFQQEYVTPNGRITSGTQTAYALALAFGLLPDNVRKQAAERLAADVQSFKHITTGFVGANLINPVLTDNGYLDLAYMLLNRQDYPSWLYPITKGATTVWERWDGIKPDGSFQDPGMNSFNHYAYGAIGDWLYRVVAGIDIDPAQPGYKHIIFRPQPGGGISSASASHHSMYGKIESAWKIEADNFHLSIAIPPNTTATVYLPAAKLENVVESGVALKAAKAILEYSQEEKSVKISLGSGQYKFSYKMN
ncbi:MAG: glycoside hydrolase family 78 protein [candidate division KSB1 bacterium]|nr:glycoside hydrolase family 78 protein [candidate division KSB1 bacterium]MDZ7341970.1 glycoside hydrolase family 78 protein [candidate division KSB1 bacterium]